jgi:hypothetical protein
MAQEVKTLADKAQGDLALDYAWLDDVSYKDWQKYHDLMRSSFSIPLCIVQTLTRLHIAYEKFDETMRTIQNGTHPQPPVDPVTSALDRLQEELVVAINAVETRIHAVGAKARNEVFVLGDTTVPSGPEVSILPIDTDSPASPEGQQGESDASQVVLGKDKVQVEEALKDIPVEHVHVEL